MTIADQVTEHHRVLNSRPGVIVFYRGGWCPYCNIALRTYQTQLVPALADYTTRTETDQVLQAIAQTIGRTGRGDLVRV